MPELPEIETIKLQLQKYLVGQEITRLQKLHPKSVSGDPGLVIGRKITGVERRGKMLVINLDKDLRIAIHFKMSGQLIFQPKADRPLDEIRSKQRADSSSQNIKKRIVGGPARKSYALRVAGGHPTLRQSSGQADLETRIVGGHPSEDWVGKLPSKHTRAIFSLKSGDNLYFNDQRLFGWVEIISKLIRQPADQNSKFWKYVEKLGPEPWDITDSQFFSLLNKRKKAVKLVIMDQEVISGVGNIYANDGLWEARIDPRRRAETLRQEDSKALRQALIKVLKEGIKYGGATAADAKYINLDGLGGHYQEHFRAYDREGKPCLRRDNGVIKKITLGSRGTYFCPICQR